MAGAKVRFRKWTPACLMHSIPSSISGSWLHEFPWPPHTLPSRAHPSPTVKTPPARCVHWIQWWGTRKYTCYKANIFPPVQFWPTSSGTFTPSWLPCRLPNGSESGEERGTKIWPSLRIPMFEISAPLMWSSVEMTWLRVWSRALQTSQVGSQAQKRHQGTHWKLRTGLTTGAWECLIMWISHLQLSKPSSAP